MNINWFAQKLSSGRTLALSLILLLAFCQEAPCLAAKMLSADDAVLLALAKSPQAHSLKLQRIIDQYSVLIARRVYEPQWTLTATGSKADGQPKTYSSNIGMDLKLLNGTTITASYQPYTNLGSSALLSIGQPLLRGFGTGQIDIANAEDQFLLQQYTRHGGFDGIISKALEAYWAVIQAEKSYEVEKLAQHQAKQVLRQYEIKVKIGRFARSRLLEQRSQVLGFELGLMQQKNNVRTAMQNLLLQIGLKFDTEININKNLDLDSYQTIPSLTKSRAVGKHNNLDVLRSKLYVEMAKRTLLLAENSQLIKLDLTGSIDQNGDKTIGLDLSIPIYDLNLKQTLVTAQVGLKQAKLAYQQALRDNYKSITNMWQTLTSQKEQIKISEENLSYDHKVYQLTLKQSLHGMVSALEVTTKQKNYVGDQQSLIDLKVSYLTNCINFMVLQGKLLDHWHVSLMGDGHES